MSKINHDQLFKELLTTFFIEFIELFFPEVLEYLDVNSITFVDKEIFTDVTKGKKKILDVVALTKFQGQDYSFGCSSIERKVGLLYKVEMELLFFYPQYRKFLLLEKSSIFK